MHPANGDLEILTGDVRLLDDGGAVVLEATGFSFKRARRGAAGLQRHAQVRPRHRDMPRPGAPSDIGERLRHASDAQRLPLLTSYVRQLVAGVLKLNPDQLDTQTALNKIGLDSIMALELRNQLDTDLSAEVPMVKFFQNLSVGGMVALLEEELSKRAAGAGPHEESSIIAGEI